MKKQHLIQKEVTIQQCQCGYAQCSTYWLNGIGHFVQSSGFGKEEAELIATAVNAHPKLIAALESVLATTLLRQTAANNMGALNEIIRDIAGTVRGALAEAKGE